MSAIVTNVLGRKMGGGGGWFYCYFEDESFCSLVKINLVC